MTHYPSSKWRFLYYNNLIYDTRALQKSESFKLHMFEQTSQLENLSLEFSHQVRCSLFSQIRWASIQVLDIGWSDQSIQVLDNGWSDQSIQDLDNVQSNQIFTRNHCRAGMELVQWDLLLPPQISGSCCTGKGNGNFRERLSRQSFSPHSRQA